jgi:hypothetical protein
VAFDLVVLAGLLGPHIRADDLRVAEPLGQFPVVIGVGEFVQHEAWHAVHFGLVDAKVGELDALDHRLVAPVLAEPADVRVVLGRRSNTGVLRVEVERHALKLGHSRFRD